MMFIGHKSNLKYIFTYFSSNSYIDHTVRA